MEVMLLQKVHLGSSPQREHIFSTQSVPLFNTRETQRAYVEMEDLDFQNLQASAESIHLV